MSEDNACGVSGVVVEAGAYYYAPADLEVAIGDTVVWVNAGGSHDVNGNISVLTGESFGNPEAFSLAIASGGTAETPVCIGSYTFTVPGVYNYDCSVGNHASLGMVATVTVGSGSARLGSTRLGSARPPHIVSLHIASPQSPRLKSPRLVSPRLKSHRIVSHRLASHRIASHRITLHRIASHHIASHRIPVQCNAMQCNAKR